MQPYSAANKNLADRIGKGKINATGRKKSVQVLLNRLEKNTKEKEESAVVTDMKQTREREHSMHLKMGETKTMGVAAPTQVYSLTWRDGRFLNTEHKRRAGTLKSGLQQVKTVQFR